MSEQEHALSLEAIQKIQSSVRFFAWALGVVLSGAIACAVWVTQISDRQTEITARVAAIEQDRTIKVEQFNQMKTDLALVKADILVLRENQATNTSTLNRIAARLGVQ